MIPLNPFQEPYMHEIPTLSQVSHMYSEYEDPQHKHTHTKTIQHHTLLMTDFQSQELWSR